MISMPKPMNGAKGKACQGLSFPVIRPKIANILAVVNAIANAVIPSSRPNKAPPKEAIFASPKPSIVLLVALYVVNEIHFMLKNITKAPNIPSFKRSLRI